MKYFGKGLRQCGKTFEDFFLSGFNLDLDLADEWRAKEEKEPDTEELTGAWLEETSKGSRALNGEGTKAKALMVQKMAVGDLKKSEHHACDFLPFGLPLIRYQSN